MHTRDLKRKRGDYMTEYYGKMVVLSVCSRTKYVSVLRGEGSVSSNDLNVNMELSRNIPWVLDKSNFYVYDLEKSK